MEVVFKIFTQTSWQIFGRAVGAVCNLAVLALVARSYGEEGTGIFTLALTYLAIFFLICDLGLNAYVLPRFSSQANKLFNFRFFWSIILVILANLVVMILPINEPLFNKSVLIGSLSIVFSGIFISTNLIFQKNLRFEWAAFASSIGTLSQIPILYFLIFIHGSVSLLILSPLFGFFISSLVALFIARKLFNFKLSKIDLDYPRKILKSAWPISLTLLLNVVYFRADTFILSTFHSLSEVGNYNLAYSVFSNVLVLPTFIMNSFYPLMLKSLSLGRREFFNQIKLSSLSLLAVSALATFLVWALSPFIIGIVGGGGFSGAVSALRILSLGFPAFFISSLLMWMCLSLRKYYSLVIIYFFGLLINLVLNFIFIPKFSFIASSFITGVSEYLILILLLIILYQQLKLGNK